MLVLAFRPGDGCLIELPGGEQAKVVFEPGDILKETGQRKIGFDFPKAYSIARIAVDGTMAVRKPKEYRS